jgi:hypothetical protein
MWQLNRALCDAKKLSWLGAMTKGDARSLHYEIYLGRRTVSMNKRETKQYCILELSRREPDSCQMPRPSKVNTSFKVYHVKAVSSE